MKPHGLRKTPSPKFVVPHVREHESGSASRTVRRFVERVGDRPAGRELDDEVGGLAHPVDGLLEQRRVQRRLVLAVAHVDVDEGGTRPLARDGGLDELLRRRRQRRDVRLGGLGAGRRDGDQGARDAACSAQALMALILPAPATTSGQGATIVV